MRAERRLSPMAVSLTSGSVRPRVMPFSTKLPRTEATEFTSEACWRRRAQTAGAGCWIATHWPANHTAARTATARCAIQSVEGRFKRPRSDSPISSFLVASLPQARDPPWASGLAVVTPPANFGDVRLAAAPKAGVGRSVESVEHQVQDGADT
jgi:hypothetical protein